MRQIILRLALAIVAFVLAGVGFFVALGFGMVGIYFMFAQFMSPTWAAFATAGSAILVSLILILAALSFSSFSRGRGRRRRSDPTDPSFIAAVLGDIAGKRFRSFSAAHKGSSIFASFAAGFALGASPQLRKILFDLARL